MLQLFAGTLLILWFSDFKHNTGIKFFVLFWFWSNLMVFIVVSPTNNIQQTNTGSFEANRKH